MHVGEMQVADEIVFLARPAQLPLIEIVEKFRFDMAQLFVEPFRHEHEQYNQTRYAYQQADLD